jgi:serine/threonine protein kinase
MGKRNEIIDSKSKDKISKEIAIYVNLKSHQKVQLHDVIKTHNNYYIVLDYCNGGNLKNLILTYNMLKMNINTSHVRAIFR